MVVFLSNIVIPSTMDNSEASGEGQRATFQASNLRKQLSGFLRQAGVRTELEPAPNTKAGSAAESRGPGKG